MHNKKYMRTTLDSLNYGDFFIWEGEGIGNPEEETLDIYQKIEKMGEYNSVLINTGKPCIIFSSAQVLKRISVEIRPIISGGLE